MTEVLNAIFTLMVIIVLCIGGVLLYVGNNKYGWWKKMPMIPAGQAEEAAPAPTQIVKGFFEEKVVVTYCGAMGPESFEIALKEGQHYLIGRGSTCDLILPDLCLSAQEAFIAKDKKGYFFSYLGRNGMFDGKGKKIDEISLESGVEYRVFLGGGPVEIHLSILPPQEKKESSTPFHRKHAASE